MNENAAIIEWNPQNNNGDKNRNVNSIGSVTPVISEVNAAGTTVPAATFLFSLGAANIIAAAAAGRASIITPNLPSRYCPTLMLSAYCTNANNGTFEYRQYVFPATVTGWLVVLPTHESVVGIVDDGFLSATNSVGENSATVFPYPSNLSDITESPWKPLGSLAASWNNLTKFAYPSETPAAAAAPCAPSSDKSRGRLFVETKAFKASFKSPPAGVYQTGAQKTWCNPNGINDLSMYPKISELTPTGVLFNASPKKLSAIPTHGQNSKNTNANTAIAGIVTSETNLFPPKNEITLGNWIVWNLLYRY